MGLHSVTEVERLWAAWLCSMVRHLYCTLK